ncbi:MAG TPA: DUF3667 domain-containing protein [Chitinophagaceae bacterium]|nr:DUF3667 domain-containing protein [Chitinophagaceae bacterium]
MSHNPERKEKDCLNCGTLVQGHFCQQCGQENIVPKQSAWGLITHFIYDLLHFDGKFFHTVGQLLFKPGFVPKAYVAGKRQSHLDPIRMYLFTSALFFLLFFSFGFDSGGVIKMSDNYRTMSKVERLEYASVLYTQKQAGKSDSLLDRQLHFLLDTSIAIAILKPEAPTNDSSFLIRFQNKGYLMEASAENRDLKVKSSSNWMEKTLNAKWKAYKKKFADDDRAMIASAFNSIVHKFPYLLFVSLPFFALILKLLYVRRKHFFYSDHAVFTLYHYIFTFILLLTFFLLSKLYNWLGWGILGWAMTLVFLSGGVYLFIAMKRFYGQGWGKTTVKFVLLNILAFVTTILLLLIFLVFSIIQL